MTKLENRITERVFLAGLSYHQGPEESPVTLAELERLTLTAGGIVCGSRLFNRPRPDAALFIGSGQVQELGKRLEQDRIDLMIMDHELKPIQQRNLEDALGVRVIDRTQLILDIFARRARSHEGKLQVELAQLMYLLPRLTGKGVQLSQQGAGIGTRGPGETKLEDDRRRLRTRIAVIKRQLLDVSRTRRLHRQDREAVPLPLVSLVGYTNAGKSALLRALTGEAALVEDKLFATLDLSTRKLILPPAQEVLLTDTVGFIRRLPHHLVAAFRGTLEEASQADLLLHVIDAAQPDWEQQAQTVDQVLAELGAGENPQIRIYNKIDRVGQATRRRFKHQFPDAVLTSALTGEGLEELRHTIKRQLAVSWQRTTVNLSYAQTDLRNLILKRGRLIRETFGRDRITLQAELPPKLLGQIKKWQQNDKIQ